MRRPDVCNRSSTRAPDGSFGSWTLARPGSASLDGDPLASFEVHSAHGAASGGRGDDDDRAPLGPGGCCDQQPLRRRPPPAAFSATGRGCNSNSDALCRDRVSRPGFRSTDYTCQGRDPSECHPRAWARRERRGRQIRFHRRRVNGDGFERIRAPSIDECRSLLSPCSRGVSSGPPPYPRLRRRGSASDAPSPLRSEGLDPRVALSSSFREALGEALSFGESGGRTARASVARRLLQPGFQPTSTTT